MADLLQTFLTRVEAQIAKTEAIKRGSTDRPKKTAALDKIRPKWSESHCQTCGLPQKSHVPHEDPQVPKPPPGEEEASYKSAQAKLYREGLRALPYGELVGMPLPISPWRLQGIREEVQDRLSKPRLSRYDMLLSEDDD